MLREDHSTYSVHRIRYAMLREVHREELWKKREKSREGALCLTGIIAGFGWMCHYYVVAPGNTCRCEED